MATNAAPRYGKQYIRYAETFECPTNDYQGAPAGVGVVEVGEFRVVCLADYVQDAGGNNVGGFAVAQESINPANTPVFLGVNQAYMPTSVASPQTARQLTVARSGLLLVEAAPAGGATTAVSQADIGKQLFVDTLGRAVANGSASAVAVAVNGTTPIVQEYVSIGGSVMVLVSFI